MVLIIDRVVARVIYIKIYVYHRMLGVIDNATQPWSSITKTYFAIL
jgi:hypothetical protein